MNALLYRLSAHLPCRIISDGTRQYLERYYVATLLGVRIYLHRFVGDDPDRGLHNHPWRWAISFILSGKYLELNNFGCKTVRFFNFLLGDSTHRILLFRQLEAVMVSGIRILVPGKPLPCWSLFLHSTAPEKEWGFFKKIGQGHAIMFQPFQYPGGYKKHGWWLKAPKGRDCKNRAPLELAA